MMDALTTFILSDFHNLLFTIQIHKQFEKVRLHIHVKEEDGDF